ncbi:multicopper oxidase LPR1 homolog 1-like isoform X1 [Telopea speciosissima]|uniref:multicopper oxidase LPR1 homolog 1-like isoform X1 n=1 Tax=Telopea speciosissima TaxID=54955 RepID=UPI001CC5CA1E|nr:multicopper oxidase LPR1 homolog 1-like isoform X1 [Telopea speciosissima]
MEAIRLLTILILLSMRIWSGAATPAPSSTAAPPPITEATLQQVAASLKMYVDELPKIPKLFGYSMRHGSPAPGNLTIGMFEKKWKFHRDLPKTTVFAYGTSAEEATIPGPVIEALKQVPTSVTWENHLPQNHIFSWDPTITTAIPKNGGVPTVVHLHGGVHPPQDDGHPLSWFTSNFNDTGSQWTQATYTYPNVQAAGNLWYHDHALGLTRVNLLAGLIGPYVIRDPKVENPLNLPSGSEFDRHLMIIDRSFFKNGSIYINSTGDNPSIHPQWQPEYFGDAIIVNGKAWPYLKVQRRKYRFRIINAANARYFNFSLSNGLPFVQIGSDSSYLNSPVQTQSILLAPAEIADVVIDFSPSQTNESILTNTAPYPYPTGSPVDQLSGNVMKFIIASGNPTRPDNSKIPKSLVNYPVATSEGAVQKRYIVLYEYDSATENPTHLYINGKSFSDPVTETPRSGTSEVWEVINLTPDNHPLHIHLATFQAIKVQELVNETTFSDCMTAKNDAIACNVTDYAIGQLLTIPNYEKTWKNVVKIEPGYQTTVVVKFNMVETNTTYPFNVTAAPGYVYHCHILDHEDNEMIRPMKLTL